MVVASTTQVDAPSDDYINMAYDWHLPKTLMGGQRAMKGPKDDLSTTGTK